MALKLNVEYYRKKLASVDAELIMILSKRSKISASIGKLKFIENAKIKQPQVWKASVKMRNKKMKKMKLNQKMITEIFQVIHKDSIQIQKKVFRKLKKNDK